MPSSEESLKKLEADRPLVQGVQVSRQVADSEVIASVLPQGTSLPQ